MKVFELGHLIMDDGKVQIFNESNPPTSQLGGAFKWFYDAHVLTLEIGERVETDFRHITRAA